MDAPTKSRPSSTNNVEDEPLKTSEHSSHSSASLYDYSNPLLEYGLRPFEDRIHQLFDQDHSYYDSHAGIISTAMEIGLTILEAAPEKPHEAKWMIWKEWGQEEKVKERKLAIINDHLYHDLDPENYTLAQVELLENLLFNPEKEDIGEPV